MAGKLRLEGNGGFYSGFESNLGLTGDVIWELPDADGADGQVMATDGAGKLSWTSAASSGVDQGDLTESTSSVLTITGGTGAIIGSGVTIEVDQADTANDGFLASTDWNTFNDKVSLTGAEVLTNKDIDGGTASNTSRITLPQNTTAALAGLTRKKGTLVYNTTTDELSVDDGVTLKTVSAGVDQGDLTESTSSVLTITGGTGAIIGSGVTIEVDQADTANDGFLASTDWNTFNDKEPAVTKGDLTESTSSVLTITGGTGAIIGSGVTIEVDQADTANDGFLASTDWNTFNDKEPAVTKGDLTESTSSVLTITGGTGAIIGSGVTIEVDQADTANDGFLASTDWNTFNDKVVGPVSTVGDEIARFSGTDGKVIQGYTSTGPSIDDTGAITISNADTSTTTDTGALIVGGGVGIEENLNVGGLASFSGAVVTSDQPEFYKDLHLDWMEGCQGRYIEQTDSSPLANAFMGGVLLPNGKVFCVPFAYTGTDYVFDPATGTFETQAGAASAQAGSAFAGGVLLPNGKVFCCSYSYSGTAYVFNPSTGTFETQAGAASGQGAFFGGVLLPNGKVFCVASNYTQGNYIFNPLTGTFDETNQIYGSGTGKFSGGVLLPYTTGGASTWPYGKVFCVPYNYTGTDYVYNPGTSPNNGVFETQTDAAPGSAAFSGGVLLPNGKVFCVPFNYSGTDYVFNPATNSFETQTDAAPGSAAFEGGVLLPNGKVFCVASSYAGQDYIFNPASGTFERPFPVGGYTAHVTDDAIPGHSGGILLPNGKVFSVPVGYTGNKHIFNPGATTKSAEPWCYHPCFNKY
jgi:hypothetical protein